MVKVPKKLAIIDGKSVFYRGYYAMPNLATKDGTPTGGVYGFAVMALEVVKRLKPDYVCVAWDKPKTNIRKRLQLYPAYKAGRKPPPPDFYQQIPILHELLDAFGWPLYELDDYEADDIMGALAVQASEKGIETMLVTSDLDMLQLINPLVNVYALKKGLSNIELFHPESFEQKYGINASQFLDLKALKGDSSDNIPGVLGIGEKGAIELLKEYQTLDGIYDNLVLIKESYRKKLEIGKESAYLSKKLAEIWIDAPIKLDLTAVDGKNVDTHRLHDILLKLEFRTLVNQLPQIMQVDENYKPNVTDSLSIKISKNNIIDSSEKLNQFKLPVSDKLYIYSRSASKHGRNPQVIIIGSPDTDVYTLDLEKLDKKKVANLMSQASSLIGYDIKNTLKLLLALGCHKLPTVQHDVLIGAFLLNSLRREQSITALAQSDIGYNGSSFEDLDKDELIRRAPEIISVISALENLQSEQMSELTGVIKVAQNIEWPVIPVLAKMEYRGIHLDTEYLNDMSERVDDIISDLEQLIYGHADQEFNIASPAQLADILFNKLKLPAQGIKKGKTGYSTAATELDKLRTTHPIIDLITQYREVSKLKNTYIDTLPSQVDENSRLHTTFALTIAQTGRLSSADPNLQNIPIRTELGKEIRTAFTAGSEQVFIGADYSQFELRLAAYLSGDDQLIEQFNKNIDVHTATAAEVYGRNPEDVTKNMRREAKVVNFGIMYGLSTHGLVAATGMTYEAAKRFIERYFEVRPKLLAYIESIKKRAQTDGFVETLYGRRRPTPDVNSSNFMVRESAYRAAVNMPFQGTEADIMKMAMTAVDKKLEGTDSKILLQIHDSILIETPASGADKVAKLVKQIMENIVDLPVKLTVDTAIGKNWGEL